MSQFHYRKSIAISTYQENPRIEITSALIVLNSAGIIIYFFTQPPYKADVADEEKPILRQRPSSSQSSSDSGIYLNSVGII